MAVVLRDLVGSKERKPAVVINGVLCTEGLCQGHLPLVSLVVIEAVTLLPWDLFDELL